MRRVLHVHCSFMSFTHNCVSIYPRLISKLETFGCGMEEAAMVEETIMVMEEEEEEEAVMREKGLVGSHDGGTQSSYRGGGKSVGSRKVWSEKLDLSRSLCKVKPVISSKPSSSYSPLCMFSSMLPQSQGSHLENAVSASTPSCSL